MKIDGRTAIITGASTGIGRETARELARRGASVVLASRSRENLEAVAAGLPARAGRCLVVPTDVTDRLAVEGLVRRTTEEFGGIDILVNNAGVGLFAPIIGGSLDNMHHLFNVNFWGAVHCIQAAAPYMRSQGRGHIVNVSSIAGRIAPPLMGMYSASKFALIALSDAVRAELSGSGVAVSTIYPGLTETSFEENMMREAEMPGLPPFLRYATAATVARRIALAIRWRIRDVYIAPEDVAAVSLNAIAPQLVDWAVRNLWLIPFTPQSRDLALPPAGEPEEPSREQAEPPERPEV